MQTENELAARFLNDLDIIAEGFIGAYGLSFSKEETHLSQPCLRWLDFVARYISPAPRVLITSMRFQSTLTPEAEPGFRMVEALLKDGRDVNPYQSKGLILFNDTSGEKRQKRTDLLWADWGIHHLHLTDSPLPTDGTYFSERADWLLFCLVRPGEIGLIAIRHHDEPDLFSDFGLIETVAESWPDLIERFRLKGILATERTPSAEETQKLRAAGVTAPVVLGGNAYLPPGRGVTTAATPTWVTRAFQKTRQCTRQLAEMVGNPDSRCNKVAAAAGVTNPSFHLCLTRQGLMIYEEVQGRGYDLPRTSAGIPPNFLAELHDAVAPEWAMKFFVSKTG